MGAEAVVKGTRIEGTCNVHLIPSASGTAPAGPRKFSAPIKNGTIASVLLGGREAAVMGASGTNDLPGTHDGIVDGPFASPTGRVGRVLSGSATVFIGGQMAATTASLATCCVEPFERFRDAVGSVRIG
ncbi:MAG TPA: PAAR domain-containing protein [Candidatus Limnocylindrales bacterium]|jgi:hypothetical protein|nr:PAAR domain-containing protein [Candidatus Limnocylindrales bacterium]